MINKEIHDTELKYVIMIIMRDSNRRVSNTRPHGSPLFKSEKSLYRGEIAATTCAVINQLWGWLFFITKKYSFILPTANSKVG